MISVKFLGSQSHAFARYLEPVIKFFIARGYYKVALIDCKATVSFTVRLQSFIFFILIDCMVTFISELIDCMVTLVPELIVSWSHPFQNALTARPLTFSRMPSRWLQDHPWLHYLHLINFDVPILIDILPAY